MPKTTCALLIAGLVAAAYACAADELAKKPASTSKIDRAVEKADAALGRTVDQVDRQVKKGVAAAEKAIDTAGKKTEQWLKEKTKTD